MPRKAQPPPDGHSDSTGLQPARDAAADCLERRLKAVHRWLKRVRRNWQDDPEPVHQLRVATRRARVAVQLFSRLLEPDEVAWAERYLKRLRKTAGAARDWDVLIARLATKPLKQVLAKQDRTRVLACLQEQRHLAQLALHPATGKSKRQRFRAKARQLLKSLSQGTTTASLSVRELASDELQPLVQTFLQQAHLGLGSIDQIHQIRIAGKHVRYALEVFASAFPTTVRDAVSGTFAELQEKLGAINDHATAIARLATLETAANPKLRSALQKLIAAEQTALDDRIEQLRATWRPQALAEIEAQFS